MVSSISTLSNPSSCSIRLQTLVQKIDDVISNGGNASIIIDFQKYMQEKGSSFRKFVKETQLRFKPYEHFTKNAIEERQTLYQKICEQIWNVDGFDKITNPSSQQ